MPIPSRLENYLDAQGARYEIVAHRRSRSSAETAHLAGVSPHQIAKSVLLEDDEGPMLAVLPADRFVMLGELGHQLGRKALHLADQDRIAALFADCAAGAVPPFGMAWGVPTIVDDELDANAVLYLESGDHERLLCMSNAQFRQVMHGAWHGHFGKTALH